MGELVDLNRESHVWKINKIIAADDQIINI